MQMTVQQWRSSLPEEKACKPFDPTDDIFCGLVRYDQKERTFKITIGAGYRDTYDIQEQDIMTSEGFLDFLLQVHSKDWATPQHISNLLDCVTCWAHRDHGQWPQVFFDVCGGKKHGKTS